MAALLTSHRETEKTASPKHTLPQLSVQGTECGEIAIDSAIRANLLSALEEVSLEEHDGEEGGVEEEGKEEEEEEEEEVAILLRREVGMYREKCGRLEGELTRLRQELRQVEQMKEGKETERETVEELQMELQSTRAGSKYGGVQEDQVWGREREGDKERPVSHLSHTEVCQLQVQLRDSEELKRGMQSKMMKQDYIQSQPELVSSPDPSLYHNIIIIQMINGKAYSTKYVIIINSKAADFMEYEAQYRNYVCVIQYWCRAIDELGLTHQYWSLLQRVLIYIMYYIPVCVMCNAGGDSILYTSKTSLTGCVMISQPCLQDWRSS